jgi:hypothetical protein
MAQEPDPGDIAAALLVSIGLLWRRLRQLPAGEGPTLPETAALSRLSRNGPATSAELTRSEQISPQAMGTTLSALKERHLVERRHDPADGRRAVMSLTGTVGGRSGTSAPRGPNGWLRPSPTGSPARNCARWRRQRRYRTT